MRQFFIVLFYFSSLSLSAQAVRVIDNMTGKSLRQAAVFIPSQGRFLETNDQGQVMLTNVTERDSLIFYYPSYSTIRITVSQLATLNYTIGLQKSSITPGHSKHLVDTLSRKRYPQIQKTDTISGDFIRFANSQTVGDAFERTGKVFIARDYPAGDRVSLRGFSGNRVLITVDGVRMSNGINPGRRGSSLTGIHPEMLDETNMIYGPGDAMGGIIKLTTKKAVLFTGKNTLHTGDALLRYATANHEKTAGFSFGVSKKKFGSMTALYYSDIEEEHIGAVRPEWQGKWGQNSYYADRSATGDTIKQNLNPDILQRTQYSDLHALQKFLFAADSNRVIGLNFQFTRLSPVDRYSRLSEWSHDTPVYSLWWYGPAIHFMASMTGDLRLKSILTDEVHLNFSSQYTTQLNNVMYFGDSIRYFEKDKIQTSSVSAKCIKNLSRKNQLEYGAEMDLSTVFSSAEADNIISRKSLLTFSWYPDGGSNMNIFALHLIDRWTINEKLAASAGVRFSRVMLDADFNDKARLPVAAPLIRKRFSGFNGNIGLTYFPNTSWKISALLSSGFRAPDLNEIAKIEPMATQVIIPNPDLKAEYSYNAELTLEKTISQTFHVAATGFYTYLQNPIGLAAQPLHDKIAVYGREMQILMNTNGNNAQILGVESSLDWYLSKNISLFSTATYIASHTGSTSVAGVPPFYGQSAIRIEEGKFRGSFYVAYNGWKRLKSYNPAEYENIQYGLPYEGSPAWYTLNFNGEYAIGKYLKIQGGIRNALDLHYRPYGSGISAQGQNIYLALRSTF